MDYFKIIDKIINDIKNEYSSNHECMTKVINYEYLHGKLFGIYEIAEATLTTEEFCNVYEYRRVECDNLAKKFNLEIINPIYKIVRAA